MYQVLCSTGAILGRPNGRDYHLLEKYAEGGYMHLWLNSERNVRGLNNLRAIIRDEPRLRMLCHEWYNNQ